VKTLPIIKLLSSIMFHSEKSGSRGRQALGASREKSISSL